MISIFTIMLKCKKLYGEYKREENFDNPILED